MSKKRRWLSVLGWVLFMLFWLFIAALVAANSVIGGIAVLAAGVLYIAAEIWISRHGEKHERVVLAWTLSWRVGLGITIVIVTLVRKHTTLGIVAAVVAACLVTLPAIAFAGVFWLIARRDRRSVRPPS
ncbi:MAG: hypothetical protein QOE43_1904 [Gaiellaceae bacterium]|nr:hypothetical protein [Gaiellaceae bacterium]